MSRQKTINKHEFRTNTRDARRHPVYIFASIGFDLIFFTITHSEFTRGRRNIKLTHNPNPKDKKAVYFHPVPIRQHKDTLSNRRKDFVLSPEDFKQMQEYMDIPKK